MFHHSNVLCSSLIGDRRIYRWSLFSPFNRKEIEFKFDYYNFGDMDESYAEIRTFWVVILSDKYQKYVLELEEEDLNALTKEIFGDLPVFKTLDHEG